MASYILRTQARQRLRKAERKPSSTLGRDEVSAASAISALCRYTVILAGHFADETAKARAVYNVYSIGCGSTFNSRGR